MEAVIFLGPPGVGKGTQAKILSQRFGFVHVSTGDIVREEREKETAIGRRMAAIGWTNMEELDQLVLDALQDRLLKLAAEKKHTRIILDGCPRTLEQASSLRVFFQSQKWALTDLVVFHGDTDALVARMNGRFSCGACGALYHDITRPLLHENCCDVCQGDHFSRRPEDAADVAMQRIEKFNARVPQVIDYYGAFCHVHHVDGMQDVEQVTHDLSRKLINDCKI